MVFPAVGGPVKGNFFKCDERVPSAGGQLQEGSHRLNFDQYGSRLEATVSDGVLEVRYVLNGRSYPFRAHPASAPAPASAASCPPNLRALCHIPSNTPTRTSTSLPIS